MAATGLAAQLIVFVSLVMLERDIGIGGVLVCLSVRPSVTRFDNTSKLIIINDCS